MFLAYAGALVIGVILLLGDLFIGTSVVVTAISAVRLSARGTETSGRVVWFGYGQPGRSVDARVSYETPGGRHELDCKAKDPYIGQARTVWYDPGKPAKATAVDRPRRRAAVGIPMAIWVAVIGAGLVVGSAWHFAGSHAQLQVPVAGGAGALLAAMPFGNAAIQRLDVLLHWRRMVVAEGTVQKYADHSPVGQGILVAFDSGDGEHEFWARAGVVEVRVGDPVTVYFDPSHPATSGTIEDASDNRNFALVTGVFAVLLCGLGVGVFISGIAGAI